MMKIGRQLMRVALRRAAATMPQLAREPPAPVAHAGEPIGSSEPDVVERAPHHDVQLDTDESTALTPLWPEVDLIVVPTKREAHGDDRVLQLLAETPRSKMLDFQSVDVLDLVWFDRLVRDWPAPSGWVCRLAIVLDYERWAIWSIAIQRKLLRLTNRGVEVDIFYAQQAHRLHRWFTHGEVIHHLPAVLGWLRHDWQRPSHSTAVAGRPARPALDGLGTDESWAIVLRRTAALIDTHADIGDVPGLRIELATMARAFGSLAGNTEALSHLSSALYWLGDIPSRTKARVLRSIAMIKLDQGETAEAIARLDTAVIVAMKVQDPTEAVLALSEIGRQAIRSGHYEGAELRLRKALTLMTNDQTAELRATVHHLLAKALLGQGKNRGETVQHATAALVLRGTERSSTSDDDRALLADIEGRSVWFQQPLSTFTPGR
jgi:tetratricopeptide (TPR) repeat protein